MDGNYQFYQKIQNYLNIICKSIQGRDFCYLFVTFSKDKKIPIIQKMKLSEFRKNNLQIFEWAIIPGIIHIK